MKYTIRMLRAEHKMSQSELAEILGISRGTLARYEKDAGIIPVKMYVKIAKIFNVEITDIFFGV